MSEVKVNKISPRSGTTITLGDSGDTFTVPSGVTFDASSGGLAGTLTTAAQPNITSVGTLTSFTSTGIDDNATSTAITINSNETSTLQCSAGDSNFALLAYHPTSTSTRTIAKFQSNVGGTQEDKVVIQTSGNVGIGTSSPDAMLHIHDDGASTSTHSYTKLHIENDDHLALQFSGSTLGEQWIWFADDTTATPVGGITYYHGGPYMGFRVEGSERMRITSGGNVGIGTSSPGQTLDVVGNAEINGNIYNNGKLNIRKDGASESEHLVITNETAGSNASPTFTDLHFNGYSGKDRARIRVQDQSNNKVGGFMRIETAGSESTDGSSFETRIFLDNDGDILFYEDTGTTAKVKWDATNERFGIGETSPDNTLHVNSTSSTVTKFERDSGSNGSLTICFPSQKPTFTGSSDIHLITGSTKRLKVAAEVAVNDDAADTGAAVFKVKGAQNNDVAIFVHKNTSGSEVMFRFRDGDQTTCGTIGIDTGSNSVSYNTTSDYRVKENVNYNFDATSRLKQLKPARFNFISNPNKTVDGFLAHEVSSIVPEAVQGEKDEMEKYREGDIIPEGSSVGDFKLDDEGNQIPKHQGIDQAKLVPLLVKTIQELEARITTLENA